MQLIDKQKIGDQVLDALRKSIMLGEIPAGSHLKENVLSTEFGVSRGPIREAISQLEKEGLVSTPSNGRTIVEGFSITDIKNLYNTRMLLEDYALSQLSFKAIQEGKEELYQFVSLMEEGHARGERDIKADLLFHYTLIKLTNNKSLLQLWTSLNGVIQTLIQVTTAFTVHQEVVITQHKNIVQFLENNEIEQARATLREHLLEAREFYKTAAIKLREDDFTNG